MYRKLAISPIKCTYVLFIFILIMGLLLLTHYFPINQKSLGFVYDFLGNSKIRNLDLPSVAGHQRSQVWQAKESYLEGNYVQALNSLDHLVKDGDLFALSLAGDILISKGETLAAINSWEKSGDVVSLQNLAIDATKHDQLYLAYLANSSICSITTDDSVSCTKAGKYLIKLKEYSEADKYFDLAIRRDPNRLSLYLTRANALRKSGDNSQAIEVYQNAIQRFPKYAPLYFEISRTYGLNNQAQNAIRAMDNALIILPNPNEKYLFLGGRIYEKGGEIQKALTLYRKLLELDPNNKRAQIAIKRLEGK